MADRQCTMEVMEIGRIYMELNSHDIFSEIKIIDNFAMFDERGRFIKIYNANEFDKLGINFSTRETYYSVSNKDVIRGMHFQAPPYEHDKIVHVLKGEIIDVIVDIRKGSPNYKKCISIHLSATKPKSIYIPIGFAHGFKCLENDTIMLYNVSSVYNRDCDAGILWNSIDYDWNISNPIVNSRDSSFCGLDEFESPF